MTTNTPVICRYENPILLDKGRKAENWEDKVYFYDMENSEKKKKNLMGTQSFSVNLPTFCNLY